MTATTASTRINSELHNRRSRRGHASAPHRLSKCDATCLARYRDRHQAKQAAKQATAGNRWYQVTTYACTACHGFHLERVTTPNRQPATPPISTPAQVGPRSYVLVDVENLTAGASLTCDELSQLWTTIRSDLGLTDHDHIIVGAAVAVSRRYRPVIRGTNISWVVGAQAADGADQALLAATNLIQVAAQFDQLVIISGDHAFADLARRAQNRSLQVHVVSTRQNGRHTLAASLARHATTQTVITIDHATPQAA